MKARILLCALLSVSCVFKLAAEEPKFRPAPIQVPAGYTVELAASPPLVAHPIMANFDERGRLFVAANAGKNLRRADLEKELPNFIRMLEDIDGDGKFDKSTIFADKMTFPQGCLWHDGALFVASSGAIWRLEDTDDDGVADKREKIVNQFGYTGNAADVHGCFLGPEGRIYWCEGRHGHEIRDANGKLISQGKAARIFSCRSDGSDVQIHCGGGMDNPVEIDFTPEGEMLGTVNIFYRKRGDCLVHWLHGGVYPRYDQPQVTAEFKRTGDLLTEAIDLGHVAVSGTTRYRGTHLGKELQDSFFICEFNTHKVVRVSLERDGSTFRGTKHEFLTSTSGDFHPTDVLEDADGSLLVVDTGGWFRIGCPTSQIAKPNILGAIYRIRKKNGDRIDDPRGRKIDWAKTQPVPLLDDPRFAVRQRAINELVRISLNDNAGGESVGEDIFRGCQQLSVRGRCHAAWTLARIGLQPKNRNSKSTVDILIRLLEDNDASVRQAAVNALGALRSRAAFTSLKKALETGDPPLRRAVATALGRFGHSDAVPVLLSALGSEVDRTLEHALIYALIEINDAGATATGLANPDPRVRRGALIALDQMDSGKLTRELVAPLLDTDDFALRQTALEVIGRRPAWGDDVVAVLKQLVEKQSTDDSTNSVLRGSIIAFANNEKVQQLVTDALDNGKTPSTARLTLLEAIGNCELKEIPESWRKQLLDCLLSRSADELRQTINTIGLIGDKRFAERLIGVSNDPAAPAEESMAALCTAAELGAPISLKSMRRLVAQINSNVPPMTRLAAARAIGAAKPSTSTLLFATQAVRRAGPLELAPLINAFSDSDNERVGEQFVAALRDSPGLTSLSTTELERVLKQFPGNVKAAAQPLFEKLNAESADQVERLAALEGKLAGGNIDDGKAVFLSKKTSCYACHRVGGAGGQVGPDLTQIGARRSKRDLLEAILYPSSSLVRGYESVTFAMADGKVHSGLIARETAGAIHIRTPQQAELRLRRDDIEELRPSRTSIMPGGLDKTMTEVQLRDLVAYLQSLK